ncbi:MAG: hypothetical protein JRJ87_02620 [Deltaproteobacteria bacterium]|nr:hypothetical protein [Deltaproteobacteria bacterium]
MARRQNHSQSHHSAQKTGEYRRELIACLLGTLLFSACGYRFSAGGGHLPDGSRQLSIPMAQNLTSDVVAGAWLTTAMRRQATQAGLSLSNSVDAPVLFVRVLRISAIPRGVALAGGSFRTREQEVVVRIELEIKRPEPWKVAISDRESYLSAPDLRGTEANRLLALQRVLTRLAQQAIERLSRGF